jgi:alpha-tubulin suppressor-like RCC1 family protein
MQLKIMKYVDKGMVSFGRNDDCQLGIQFVYDAVSLPTKVATPLDEEIIVSLACGYHHTVAVTNAGSVYVFGKNEYGQLGLGHQRPVKKPTVRCRLHTRFFR